MGDCRTTTTHPRAAFVQRAPVTVTLRVLLLRARVASGDRRIPTELMGVA